MRTILTLLFAFMASGTLLAEEISPEDWILERKEHSEPMGSFTAVRVQNPYGDIRVRSHHKSEVYVLVNAQRHKDDPFEYQLDICEGEEVLDISASLDPYKESVPEAFEKRRMDMTVFLPSATDMHMETTRGFVESRGMAGELEITSEWGNVRTRHAGPVEINTPYGNVEAVLLDTRWSQDSQIETLTGAIEVRVAKNSALKVTMETGGELATDYTLKVDFDEETSFKTARARLGKRGKSLFLTSSRGKISLFRFEIEQP